MQQIAVGGVDFHHLEARRHGPDGRRPEVGRHLPDACGREGLGRGVVRGKGFGAGGHGLPAARVGRQGAVAQPGAEGAGFAPGVGQLDARHAALRPNEIGDAPQHRHLRVVPEAEVGGRDAAFRGHGRGFLHDEGRPAHRPAAQVYEVPVGGPAFNGAVLAHGRHHQPVFEGEGAEGERAEQCRHERAVKHGQRCPHGA